MSLIGDVRGGGGGGSEDEAGVEKNIYGKLFKRSLSTLGFESAFTSVYTEPQSFPGQKIL